MWTTRFSAIEVLSPHVLYFDATHRRVGCELSRAPHVFPFRVGFGRLEQPFLLLARQHPANRLASGLREHLHVVLKPPPLFEALQHLAERTDVHVDRAVARALESPLRLKALDHTRGDRRQTNVAKHSLDDLQPFAVELDRSLRVGGRLLRLEIVVDGSKQLDRMTVCRQAALQGSPDQFLLEGNSLLPIGRCARRARRAQRPSNPDAVHNRLCPVPAAAFPESHESSPVENVRSE